MLFSIAFIMFILCALADDTHHSTFSVLFALRYGWYTYMHYVYYLQQCFHSNGADLRRMISCFSSSVMCRI